MTQCQVWKPEIIEKQVECVRYVPQTITKKVPYTVCRMVPEQQTYQVPYTVCRAEQYQRMVPCCHYVAKQVPYTMTRCEPRVITVQVPVRVCCPMPSCCGGAHMLRELIHIFQHLCHCLEQAVPGGTVRNIVSNDVARPSWPWFFTGWKPVPQNPAQSLLGCRVAAGTASAKQWHTVAPPPAC